jgi:signal transduction histidine kinase
MTDDALEDAGHGKPRSVERGRPGRRKVDHPRLSSGAIHDLLRADSRAEIFRQLADLAVAEVGADGAVIVELLPDGDGQILEARGAPATLASWRGELEVVDAELGERLLAVTEGRFVHARTLPLACGGSLFGALVLFYGETAPGDGAVTMAQALVDIAATELDKELQRAELRRSNAELRASREVLERTEKLRALGEMSAGISHDLLNILNPLSLHLELLRRILKRSGTAGTGAQEAVDEMGLVVKRGVETVARLRDFSRQAPEAPIEVVALDAVAHEAIELSRPRIATKRRARGIRIVAESGAPPLVRARSSELLGALLNLLVNAVDAMEDGGTITVATGAADEGAWVQVADDGPGIPEALQRRIFEPFFTTKGKAGTGLGLAMVYACVQRHAGKLTLDSAPGQGTRFTLWFPCGPIEGTLAPGGASVPHAEAGAARDVGP